MNDALGMGVTQCGQYLVDVVQGLDRRERPPLQTMGQGVALDVLHDHDELIVGRESRPERRDIGMIEAGQQLDLAHEASAQVALIRQVGQQHLHGLNAVRNEVAHQKNLAHPSVAEFPDDLVVTDLFAYWFCHIETSKLERGRPANSVAMRGKFESRPTAQWHRGQRSARVPLHRSGVIMRSSPARVKLESFPGVFSCCRKMRSSSLCKVESST